MIEQNSFESFVLSECPTVFSDETGSFAHYAEIFVNCIEIFYILYVKGE